MQETLTGPYISTCPPLLRDVTIFGFAGFGVVAVAYAGYGILYEVVYPPRIMPGMVVTSYGQAWGFSLFVAGLLGLTAGWSLAFSIHRWRLIAAALSLIGCIGTAVFALSSWDDKITNYGHDFSHSIVYAPLPALSAVVFASVWTVSAIHAILTRAKQSKNQVL
jgi:hypothetical protein